MARIRIELVELEGAWGVTLDVFSADPLVARSEVYRFSSEDEAHAGLIRALHYSEDLRKHGFVDAIESAGAL